MTNREAAEYLDKYVMNVAPYGKWKEVVELAISALQAQEAKTQLSAEGTTSDLISRQDAIEVIEEMQMPIMRSMFPEEQFVFKGMSEALSAIKDLPSAHSEIEERKEESAQNVPKEDLISRKAAIEAMSESLKRVFPEHRQIAEKCLKALPSAQPERKKGKWIPQDFNKHSGMASTLVYYYPKCSVCGKSANYTNFCPNCGADMRGDNDD